MRKKKLSGIAALLMAVVMMTASLLPMTAQAEENDVKVSETTYGVQINGNKAFVCNEVALDAKVGTEMYLTYTVGKVDSSKATQHGVGGNPAATASYPYRDGGFLYFKNGDSEYLLEPETTYFMKFVVTENGFDYTIGWAKEDKSGRMYFKNQTGKGTSEMKHIGLWLDGGSTSVRLNDVHCYDREGNDLGIAGSGIQVMPQYAKPFAKATQVKHLYTVTVENQMNMRIYNEKKTDSDTIYFEYKVKSSDSKIYQSGVTLNDKDPSSAYGSGQYVYELLSMKEPGNGFMLVPGAEYWIECRDTHTDKGWVALIQRTYKGETEWFRLSGGKQRHSEHVGFSSLFFGEGGDYRANFVLTDMRCYDGEYNNLGIATNKADVVVEHEGEILDYSGCDNVYYSKEKNTLIAVYPDKTLLFTKDGQTTAGSYFIDDVEPLQFTMTLGNETTKYTYYNSYLLDAENNRYNRLSTYTVQFRPGNGAEDTEQVFSTENGYVITKPEDPTLENDKFLYWCTRDGKEYDFSRVVTESAILYAKWEKGGILEYEVLQDEADVSDYTPYVAIGLSVVIVVATVVTCVMLMRKGNQNENGKKKKTDK